MQTGLSKISVGQPELKAKEGFFIRISVNEKIISNKFIAHHVSLSNATDIFEESQL